MHCVYTHQTGESNMITEGTKISTAITRAKKILTEHIDMLQKSISECSHTEHFTMCVQLEHQKRGLQMALEDVSSLEIGLISATEYIEVEQECWNKIQSAANYQSMKEVKKLANHIQRFMSMLQQTHEYCTKDKNTQKLFEITLLFCRELLSSIEEMSC